MKMVCLPGFLPVVLGIIVLPLISVTARAGVIYEGDYFDIEVSLPFLAEEGLPLWAVTLTAVCVDSVEAGAFDGIPTEGNPNRGIRTTGDSLHQVWEFGFGNLYPTPTLELQGTYDPSFMHLDTHFLVESFIPAPSDPPDESGLVSGSPMDDSDAGFDAGFGDALFGGFSVLNGATEPVWGFAYVVVPWGTEVSIEGDIAVTIDSEGEYIKEGFATSFVVVPEPSMLILLALGALGLLVKRVQKCPG